MCLGQQELSRKGVQAEVVASTIESAYAEVSEEELVRRYVARRRIKKPQDENRNWRLSAAWWARAFLCHHL